MTKKNKQNKPVIDEGRAAHILPGMLMSGVILAESGNTKFEEQVNDPLYFGKMVSATIIIAQCAELLLKYKIQQEGNSTKNTHDLYKLYKLLSEESKAAIEKEFAENESVAKLPNGWDSPEGIFLKARNSLVHWRYIVESPKMSSPMILNALYIVTLSVYKTTQISRISLGSFQEVTDPAMKNKIQTDLFQITK